MEITKTEMMAAHTDALKNYLLVWLLERLLK